MRGRRKSVGNRRRAGIEYGILDRAPGGRCGNAHLYLFADIHNAVCSSPHFYFRAVTGNIGRSGRANPELRAEIAGGIQAYVKVTTGCAGNSREVGSRIRLAERQFRQVRKDDRPWIDAGGGSEGVGT